MDKLNPKTDRTIPDLVEQNIEKMKALFPDVVTEGKIDFDALRETLGEYVDEQSERYSFTWNGKSQARRIAQTPSTGTLRPCPEDSVNWDTTQNLFIEGDNLEVLKLLQKSYHKKVKLIYIDPPYNTGKEFIYPDKYMDNLDTYLKYTGQIDDEGFKLSANTETSGRYHTNWLNMMYPRLKLARNLLRDDGVIFTSIDYREAPALRLIMNEIFGEENLVFDVSIVNNLKGRNDRIGIATCHEQLLIYGKHDYVPRGLSLTPEQEAEYSNIDEHGRRFQWRDLRKRGTADTRAERPQMYFPLYVDPITGKVAVAKDDVHTIEVFPRKSDDSDGRWRWGKEKVNKNISIIRGAQVRGKERWNLSYPVYLESDGNQRRSTPKSVWMAPKYSTDAATRSLGSLFPGIVAKKFTPKSVGLLQDIIDQAAHDSDIILDFFAGTGTLAEAVLRQNLLESVRRPFIVVQLPEPLNGELPGNYCDIHTIADFCKERIRKVCSEIKKKYDQISVDADERLPGFSQDLQEIDLGFKAFKLDSSNIIPWDADFDNLEAALFDSVENIKPDRSEDDVLYEILLKFGLDLAVPIEERVIDGRTVYIVGAGALIVCLAKNITLDVVEGIAALKEKLQPEIMRVVFKDSGFADDVVKTNTVQILRQAGIDDVKSL
jgi:adenine-specific DNA-methyltransferase